MNDRVIRFRLTAIIPSAGRSTRMGAFKPVLPWPPGTSGDMTVIEAVVSSIRDACKAIPDLEWRIIVVGGHRLADVIRAVDGICPGLTIVENPVPDAPMSSSVAIAMRAAIERSHVLVLPGDHPAVQAETIRMLLEAAFSLTDTVQIPVFKGRRGHPVILPPGLHGRLLEPDPRQGLRAIIHDPKVRVVECDTPDSGVIVNLDHPSDYHL